MYRPSVWQLAIRDSFVMWPFNLFWSTPGLVPPEYYTPEEFKDDFKFPKGFFHGYATAAPQIEGGVKADGRGPSVWDPFSHKKGNVLDGSTTEVTTGSYKVGEDFLPEDDFATAL